MIPETPDQWLQLLTRRLDLDRVWMQTLTNYVSGAAPLPEGATKVQDAYVRWQRLARTDFPNLIVDAPAERLQISGFQVGDDAADNDDARALWRASRMESVSADIHRDTLIYGRGYGMAAPLRGGAVLTRESPLSAIVDPDPLIPGLVRAGLKTWIDGDTEHAYLHLPGWIHPFVRAASGRRKKLSGGWQPETDPYPSGLDVVPMVEFTNRDGIGEFALHTDLIDRINWVLLQRLLIIAMQAFRQRAIKGELDKYDAEGNEIDYQEMFAPGPDALWTLPDGIDIWESSPADIQQILSAAKDDIRDLSAVTRTPMSVLSPDSANQSAEGATLMREGLVYKVEDRQRRFAPSWEALVGMGLELANKPAQVQVQWAPAERVSLAERYDALAKAGVLPWRRQMADILGYPADVIDQMETERAADTLTAAMALPSGTPEPPAAQDAATAATQDGLNVQPPLP